jgi:SSS family solute:Na+ symporter
VLLVAALWAPLVQQFDYIFSYFQECWAFIAVPVAVIFVMGVLWKGISDSAAFWTLCLSFPLLVLPYLLRLWKVSTNVYHIAGLVLIFTVLFCVVASLLRPKNSANDIPVVTKDLLRLTGGRPWYTSVPVWATLILIMYLLLYVFYW